MFTNQNQSSGKFWVTAFIVGLLIFLGQFAHSDVNTGSSCVEEDAGRHCLRMKRADGSTYYTALGQCNNQRNGRIGCMNTSTGTCRYGVNFCISDGACSRNGGSWVNGKCVDKSQEQGHDYASWCKNAKGEKWNGADCQCKDGTKLTKEQLGNEEVCVDKKADENSPELAPLCDKAKGGVDGDLCSCPAVELIQITLAELKQGAKCPEVPAPVAAAPSETPAGPSIEARLKNVLDSCGHTELQNRIDQCEEKAQVAVEKCDADAIKSDKNAAQLGAVTKLLGTVQQGKAVQRADPDACGKAAYVGSAATLAIDMMKKTCDEEVKTCKDSCAALKNDQTFNQIKQECERRFNAEFQKELGVAASVTGRVTIQQAAANMKAERMLRAGKMPDNISDLEDLKTAMRNDLASMEKKARDNLVKCETDAVSGETDIAKYLAEILGASVSAAQCKNLASNNAARCAAMASQLTPAWCQANASEVCCAPFIGGIVDCNGKDYSAQQCVCARTPDAAICNTVASTPTAPTLANPGGVSNLTAPGGIKAGNQYKPSGTLGGGFEVGNDMDPSKPTAAPTAGGSTNPFGTTGGGGGGGGGVPNSPNDPNAAAPVASEEKGSGLVGGAFNQLKTLADRILGGGNGSGSKSYGNGSGKDSKKNGAVDPNKFRPGLRGLAGGASPFGPRNKDIWKIMNAQYGIQNHTFISNEK